MKNERKGRSKEIGTEVSGTLTEYDGHGVSRGTGYGESPDSGRWGRF